MLNNKRKDVNHKITIYMSYLLTIIVYISYTRVYIDNLSDRKHKTTRSSVVVIFCNQHFRIYFVSYMEFYSILTMYFRYVFIIRFIFYHSSSRICKVNSKLLHEHWQPKRLWLTSKNIPQNKNYFVSQYNFYPSLHFLFIYLPKCDKNWQGS